MNLYIQLTVSLVIIVIAAEIFTNALEHLGERLKISEGVTGSLFAAVGTAMPESMIPVLALLAGTQNQELNEEIGVGAILGAPLMLSTVALCLMALSVVRARGLSGVLKPERTGLERDTNFFLFAFGVATVALFIPHRWMAIRAMLAAGLVVTYFIYVLITLRNSAKLVKDGHGTESHKDLLIMRLRLPDTMPVILFQIALGLALLIAGAKGFIHSVEHTARILGVSALLLSLLIIPIATELPEKVNSILWIRRGKDTLAFGNITGAMVFQGTLLPAIGILLTPWEPRREVAMGVMITYVAAIWLRVAMQRGKLKIWQLWVNGGLYLVYLGSVLV
jgi:cation:H+ antiporter